MDAAIMTNCLALSAAASEARRADDFCQLGQSGGGLSAPHVSDCMERTPRIFRAQGMWGLSGNCVRLGYWPNLKPCSCVADRGQGEGGISACAITGIHVSCGKPIGGDVWQQSAGCGLDRRGFEALCARTVAIDAKPVDAGVRACTTEGRCWDMALLVSHRHVEAARAAVARFPVVRGIAIFCLA